MELALANTICNFLLLLFKSLLENFFLDVPFFLQTFSRLLLTGTEWDYNYHSGTCHQSSVICESPCRCEADSEEDEERIRVPEMMDRVGVACGLEGVKGSENLRRQDLLSLFEDEEPSLEEIKETFDVFDVNNDGFIDAGEVQRVVCNLGFKQGCELEDCKRMIRAFDGNGDGLIDFQEFVKLMEKCLC